MSASISLGLSLSIRATVLSWPIILTSRTFADLAAAGLRAAEYDLSSIGSLHKTLDRLVKIVYCLLIVTRDRVNDAVLNMIF